MVAIVPESVEPWEPSKGRIVRCFHCVGHRVDGRGTRCQREQREENKRTPQEHVLDGVQDVLLDRARDGRERGVGGREVLADDRNGFRELGNREVVLEVVADRPVRKSTSESRRDSAAAETRRDNLIPTQAPTRPWPGRGSRPSCRRRRRRRWSRSSRRARPIHQASRRRRTWPCGSCPRSGR